MISVREVDLSDGRVARELLAVQVAAYAIEAELLEYPQLPPLFETVADLRASGERFLAAFEGHELVGATSVAVSDDVLDICRMVVSPAHMRRGIASRLLSSVEELRDGHARITVSTGEANIPAIRLYEKHGFAVVQRRALPDGLKLVGLEKRFER
ncbi:MAG: GNAT family N-acetyltransferase [Thermoanaerobaculia bacterium]|jgi:ribosomal protein S18 acetylase RimI-like enzyme